MVSAGDEIRARDETPGKPRSLGHYGHHHRNAPPPAVRVPDEQLERAREEREERERIWRAVRNIARGD